MSSTGGRPRKIQRDDIFDALENADSPVITSGDVAEVAGSSSEAARNRLADLEDEGLLASRKVGARAKVWYLATQPETAVVGFPQREEFILLSPGNEMLDAAQKFAKMNARNDNYWWFSTGANTFAHTDYRTVAELRADVETVLGKHPDWVDRLVARWRGERGVIIRDESPDGLTIQAPEPSMLEVAISELPDEIVDERKDATSASIEDTAGYRVARTLDKHLTVSDFRDTSTEFEEFWNTNVVPAQSGHVDDVPPGCRILGVDNDWRIHLYSTGIEETEIFVVDDREIIHSEAVQDDTISSWVEFIASAEGQPGWMYLE